MHFPTLADLWAIDLLSAVKQSTFIGTPEWTVHDMHDMAGRVVIVTGGNSGIGKETAKALLSHNAKVYLACRDEEKATHAIDELERGTGKRAIFLHLDLSNLRSVRTAATEFLSREKDLHILFNNAGVMFPPHSLLAGAYDLTWHTNVLGPFYFTKLLLSVLLSTAQRSPPKSVRIIHTSSAGHYFCWSQPLNFATFKDGPERNRYTVQELYFQSKLANIVLSDELQRRYADRGLVSIAVNPGNIDTALYRYSDAWYMRLGKIFAFLRPIPLGAITQLYAGTAGEAGNYGGQFLVPWAKLGKPRPETQDPQLGKELWTWLEEQVADM